VPNIDFTDSTAYNINDTFYQGLLDSFRKQGIPGTVMLLKKPDEPLWISASGKSNLDKNTDMSIGDHFHIASITKTFVSVCVFKLIEEKKLKLTDTLAALLPEMKGKIANAENATVRNLLSHTSGIPDYYVELVFDINRINDPKYSYTQDDFLNVIYNKPALFNPGSKWQYSNTNMVLLLKIVEMLERKNMQEVMQERIFTPLGMSNTYLSRRSDGYLVRGYADYYNCGKIMDVTDYAQAVDGSAGGGMVSTAYDLYLFAKAIFDGSLLSSGSIEQMEESVTIPQDEILHKTMGFTECGLGIMKLVTPGGHTGWGHTGNIFGFGGQRIIYFPDIDTYFILLVNRGWDNDESGNLLWPYSWENIFDKAVAQ
jgi:D-alanyl-D-alanine carboxypeptidase